MQTPGGRGLGTKACPSRWMKDERPVSGVRIEDEVTAGWGEQQILKGLRLLQ